MAKKSDSAGQTSAENGETAVAYDWKTEVAGVYSRHSDKCPKRHGRRCTCGPRGYRASVGDPGSNLRIVSPKFATAAEAQTWQRDQLTDSAHQSEPAGDRLVLGDLIDEFLQAAENGAASDPWGTPYQGESLRTLKNGLSRINAELGQMTVAAVRRRHVQEFVSQLRGSGMAPARISAIVDALTALYAYAVRRDLVGFSPVVELDLYDTERIPPTTGGQPTFPSPPVAGPGTPPPFIPPAAGWTPQPFVPPAAGWTPPPYVPPTAAWTPPPYVAQNNSSDGFVPPQQAAPNGSGPFSGILGAPGPTPGADANYDATMQERWLWWTVRIIVIVFVLIALVLVAESV
jgi:hypothetical protein